MHIIHAVLNRFIDFFLNELVNHYNRIFIVVEELLFSRFNFNSINFIRERKIQQRQFSIIITS